MAALRGDISFRYLKQFFLVLKLVLANKEKDVIDFLNFELNELAIIYSHFKDHFTSLYSVGGLCPDGKLCLLILYYNSLLDHLHSNKYLKKMKYC
jgi:hypothetical protein